MRRGRLHAVVLRVVFSAALMLAVMAVAPLHGAGVLDQLKTRFNQDSGALRLVVLVSPTCPAVYQRGGVDSGVHPGALPWSRRQGVRRLVPDVSGRFARSTFPQPGR